MRLVLLLFFIVIPLAEIALLIRVGQAIGTLETILIVIATAVAGTAILQRQGLATFMRAQSALGEGRFPVESVIDGAALLVAGAFLLTPGLITDAIGFLLFIPAVRRAIARFMFKGLRRHIDVHIQTHPSNASSHPRTADEPGPLPGDGPVIDGEFEHVSPDSASSNEKPTPWNQSTDR